MDIGGVVAEYIVRMLLLLLPPDGIMLPCLASLVDFVVEATFIQTWYVCCIHTLAFSFHWRIFCYFSSCGCFVIFVANSWRRPPSVHGGLLVACSVSMLTVYMYIFVYVLFHTCVFIWVMYIEYFVQDYTTCLSYLYYGMHGVIVYNWLPAQLRWDCTFW